MQDPLSCALLTHKTPVSTPSAPRNQEWTVSGAKVNTRTKKLEVVVYGQWYCSLHVHNTETSSLPINRRYEVATSYLKPQLGTCLVVY